MKIYLATWIEENQGVSLSKQGARQRLMSYFFIRDMARSYLTKYIKNGVARAKEAKK